jgi:hypothetical protein
MMLITILSWLWFTSREYERMEGKSWLLRIR